jgi:hypothetical protein
VVQALIGGTLNNKIIFAFRKRIFMKHAFLISALLASSMAYAGSSLDGEAIQFSLAAGNVSMQRQQIEAKLTQVEYTELTKDSRISLNEQFALLESSAVSGASAKLAEERINGILKQTFADSKLVCSYEKPLGSNMMKRSCMTTLAKKRNYDATQRNLKMQKTPSNPYGSQ